MEENTWKSPLKNWKDRASRNQIINQIIIEEYPKKNWRLRAKQRLEEYGIYLTKNTITNHKKALKNGTRNPLCPSIFSGAMNSRFEKELVYSQVYVLEEIFVGMDSYIGLPANQIIGIANRYKFAVACEKNTTTYNNMVEIKNNFDLNIEIKNEDIIEFLEKSNHKFSRFDFDLMEHLSASRIEQIACSVNKTSTDRSIVNIISCSGRSITDEEYKYIPIIFKNKLDLNIKYHISGKYQDAQTPMRYEIFVLG